MSVSITITLPPESQALIQRSGKLRQEFPVIVKRGMDRALDVVKGRVIGKRLLGKGPFDPSLHRIGEVTQKTMRSTRFEPARILGTSVIGAIGTETWYAELHEYGSSKHPRRAPFTTEIVENTEYIAQEIANEIAKTFREVAAKGS
jgi:hypothetical protein